mgnify:CR=1 FL=1
MPVRKPERSFALRKGALAASLIASFVAVHASAQAATASGAFAVRGLGAQACKDITAVAASGKADDLVQLSGAWIAGYVSQFNRINPNVYEAMPIVDNVVLGKLAINICRANPDTLFEAVASSLITSFSRGALSEDSAIVEIKSDKSSSAFVRRAVFRLVQHELIKEGFLPAGSADGDYGPASRAALSKYQEARGITMTGIPDPQTLIHLFAMGDKAQGSGKN